MNNEIHIDRNGLQQQIDLRNYYMGESAKRKDIDADTIQSSKDDEELLYMLLQRACNELTTAVALRFPSVGFEIGEEEIVIAFETDYEVPEHLLSMLQQSITDHLVNETNVQWLLLRRPDMAQTYISQRIALYNNALMMFAKIYNRKRVRRRPTDLAGI